MVCLEDEIKDYVVVQSLSCVRLFTTPWTAARQPSLTITISPSCSDSHLLSWWCHPSHPLLPPFLLAFRVFSNELALPIRRPEYWNFSISPSNGYSGLITFRIDWFDLLPVQGTLKSLLQHYSLKASILRPSAFFMSRLSYDYWKKS